tara:strand:- start:5543 stop:5989 length:447 start_codon:yes stop_codon:yes gene_type:complete
MKLKVYKTRKSAKLPARAHPTDAGMDFFYAPESGYTAILAPGQSALLETGIKMQVPAGHMLQIMNKSGIAAKRQLITGACVVDEGYEGEIFVNLMNCGRETQSIEPGQKIAQGVFVRISTPFLVEVDNDEIYDSPTSRGAGALGSTGV